MSAEKPEQEAKEIELKLSFDPSDADVLAAHPVIAGAADTRQTRELISIYHDTHDGVLHERGVFLRVRTGGGGYIQTIKTARGDGEFLERDEWECTLTSLAPDLDAAKGTALETLLTEKVRAALQPRFETKFQRETYMILDGVTEVELAVDRGTIAAGPKVQPICELELELKSGDRQSLFALARTLVETLPLTLAVKTKAERGFELLDQKNDTIEKARPIAISPDETCAQAFQAIARNCLRQILVNLPAMWARNPEALHQVRVGMRRLRAAITFFSDVVTGEERQSICDELKWIAGALGPARDLDVLIADILEPRRVAHADDAELEALHKDALARRRTAYDRAIEVTNSRRFRVALIDLGAWIELGDWTGDDNLLGQEDIADYAARKLTRLRRTIKKKGKNLRDLTAAERHRLRIRTKRLRYATEFFASTFVDKRRVKRRRKSLRALQRLQDALGMLNDIATRQTLLAGGAPPPEQALAPMPDVDLAEQKRWLKEAKRAYERFADVKAFWKL